MEVWECFSVPCRSFIWLSPAASYMSRYCWVFYSEWDNPPAQMSMQADRLFRRLKVRQNSPRGSKQACLHSGLSLILLNTIHVSFSCFWMAAVKNKKGSTGAFESLENICTRIPCLPCWLWWLYLDIYQHGCPDKMHLGHSSVVFIVVIFCQI